MTNKWLILPGLCFLVFTARSQSGYYGSTMAVELKAEVAPSVWRTLKYDETVQELHHKRRFAYLSYGANFALTTRRRCELSLGAEYTRMRTISDFAAWEPEGWNDTKVLNDPAANAVTGKFEFKFYRKGTLAPIGKYFGVSAQGGVAWITTDVLPVGYVGNPVTSDFFDVKYDIIANNDTVSIYDGKKVGLLSLQLKAGRIVPVNKRMSVLAGVSFPLTTIFFTRHENLPILPFTVSQAIFRENRELDPYWNRDWAELLMYSVERYSGFCFELGMRVHL